MKKLWKLVASLALLSVAACSDLGVDPPDEIPAQPPEPTVSFANDIQPIFAANCVGCHGNSGGLSLKPAGAYVNLVNQTSSGYSPLVRVAPGSPDESLLYLKMMSAGNVGDSMPPDNPLDAATLEKVRVWIEEGALEN